MKVALGCIAKMEELYICEWIEHYKKLGFSHIFIADNNYSGYKYPLQSVIQSYIDEGYVTVINYIDVIGRNTQIYAYDYIYNMVKDEYDWIAFLDIDEFLELPQNNNISEFISRQEFNEFNVINIPWKLYDANNNFYYSPEPVQERFPTPSIKISDTIKSIIKCMPDKKIVLSQHDPNDPENECVIHRCNVLGKSRQRNLSRLNDYEMPYIIEMYKVAYIKHYWCKSLEEFIMYRTGRGNFHKDDGKDETKFEYNINKFFKYSNKSMKEHQDIINNIINEITNSEQYIQNKKNADVLI